MHGPPGSGKSSFIRALAGAFNYEICVLNLAERGLTDDRLNYILSNLPERSILLMEDVDAAFNKRVQVTEDGYVWYLARCAHEAQANADTSHP